MKPRRETGQRSIENSGLFSGAFSFHELASVPAAPGRSYRRRRHYTAHRLPVHLRQDRHRLDVPGVTREPRRHGVSLPRRCGLDDGVRQRGLHAAHGLCAGGLAAQRPRVVRRAHASRRSAARPRRRSTPPCGRTAASTSSTASSTPTGERAGSGSTASAFATRAARVIAIEGIVQDITARVESEHALREAERRYRSLFDNAIEGIFRTTPDGRYLDANPALARIYGFATPQELIDSLRDIKSQLYVDPGRREEFMRIVKARGEISGFESRVYRKNGDVIWISENARAVFDDEGRVLHYEGTVEDITERRMNQARIEQQANYDSLTGLANRSLLNDRLQQAIYSAASYGARLAVVFVDLDRFKYINDTLGHDVGDRLLQVMAERFTSAVPESDTVARLGGDEFVLLLHGQAGPDTVTTVLERLLPTISAPLRYGAERSRSHLQHRRGAVSRRRQRPCDAAEARRLGDVSRQGAGPQQLSVLHRGSESCDQGAARPRKPAAARARARPVRAALPAARRPADAQDHRRRSADALALAGARHGIAGDVHPGRRGDRPHRPDQRVGAARRRARRTSAGTTRACRASSP